MSVTAFEFLPVAALCVTGFCASLLGFYSGFGLGTILMPVFSVFFPLPLAIAMTALVHLSNNLFKLWLTGAKADWRSVIRFGIPSVAGALTGAWCLQFLSLHLSAENLVFNGLHTSWLKLCLGLLIIVFALLEWNKGKALDASWPLLTAGGLTSGFFGGLSGHQGALRTLFLKNLLHEKEVFIATGVVIACMVDFSRIGIYSGYFSSENMNWTFVAPAALSAMLGAWLGSRLIRRTPGNRFRIIVAACLVLFGMMLASGAI